LLEGFVFEFLTRSGCHLCDDARALVNTEVTRRGGQVREIDIDTDDALVEEFGRRVPVLRAPDGVVVAEGVMDRRSIRSGLRRVAARLDRG
jgi:hypothetical protein